MARISAKSSQVKIGFTLIELLIVVAIIAILAAIAVPNFLEAQVRSKVSRVKSDLRTVATCLEMYYVDNNRYPMEGLPGGAPGMGAAGDGVLNEIDPVWDAGLSLIRLTTPVAYLSGTGLLRDPFLERSQPLASPGIDPNIKNFFYVDYLTFAEMRFSAPDDREIVFKGWGLSSVGPDRLSDGACFAPWQVGRLNTAADTSILRRIYDPTNGTVSAGDLARFGGEIPPHALALTRW